MEKGEAIGLEKGEEIGVGKERSRLRAKMEADGFTTEQIDRLLNDQY